MALPNRDPFLGLTLDGKYEIVSAIARGGMGRVYKAIQQPLGREVALKVLDMEQLEGKKVAGDFARRFFLEAASCAKLTHPNTVVVYDYGKTEDDIFYIAMELLHGNTLDRILEELAPLDPISTIHIALQICGSIGEAHSHGMVHRDLKPSNIMLTQRGGDPNFVKVLDFGLVKDEADVGLTQSGALLGTPRYIAPEQIATSDVGPESDIYSFAAVLYHCLTGRPPFDSDSKFVLLASHINVKPPEIEEIQPDTPASRELCALIMKCLQKERQDRFPSMQAVVEALMACPEETNTSVSSLTAGGALSLSGITLGTSSAGELERSGVKDSATTRPKGPSAPTLMERPSAKEAKSIEDASAQRSKVGLLVALGLMIGLGGVGIWWTTQAPVEPTPIVAPTEPIADPEPERDPEPIPSNSTRVRLETTPPGARVQRDGRDLGDSPVLLVVPEGEMVQVRVELRGYETREVAVTGGQEQVTIALERTRRSGTMRRDPSNGSMTPDTVEEPTMEAAMAGTMEPAMEPTMTVEMGMRPRTDNRDPWAR